jgi:large subunit ribosomal protein L22
LPEFGYSYTGYNPTLQVRASLREVDVSPKAAREVCEAIKGLRLEKARALLEDVIALKQAIPFRRYKKKVSHKGQVEKFYAGRYPVKAAKLMLKLLDNLEANADFKGLDITRIRIVHASAYPGRKIKKYFPRAFGRSSPDFKTLVHIEIVGEEE